MGGLLTLIELSGSIVIIACFLAHQCTFWQLVTAWRKDHKFQEAEPFKCCRKKIIIHTIS